MVFAETGATPAYVIAPQNYLSDFPNEQLSIQTRKVSMVYNDIVIPGNEGMDIVVTRRMGGSKVKFDRISIGTSYVYAADDPVFNLSCLGDFQGLSVSVNGQRLIPTGYDAASQIPSSGFAFFSNGTYFKCENSKPTLYFANGKKYTFIQVRLYETAFAIGKQYYVETVTDRHGNYITYNYEDSEAPASYDRPQRLKTITRNDGQIVNFIYTYNTLAHPSDTVTEINYSGKKIEYRYESGRLDTFIDAEGRETKYTYAMYTGIGNQIDTITTPEGLLIDYRFSPYTENIGLRSFNMEAGESGGLLVSKSISGPGVDLKRYSYHSVASTAEGTRTLVVQRDYKDELDLTTEYTIRSGHFDNNVGQVLKVRGFEGEFTSGDIIGQYSGHSVLYELSNTWEQINSGTIGCHQATDLPIYGFLYCSRYEKSNVQLKIKNGSIFDTYTTNVSSFNIYGQPLTTTESFGSNTKVTTQSYDHDISNWIINQPRITKVGPNTTSLANVKETTYYSKDHANYPFMPFEEKSFGTWQKKYSEYHADGNIKKVEYNQALSFGDISKNRYQTYTNYKRGLPQTITQPKRITTGAISWSQVVDDNGWVTQTTDLNGNVVNKGYDKIGRLKYIDPVDSDVADTLFTWSYDGGSNSDQPKNIVSRCTLNTDFTACSDTAKQTITTVYDGFLRPIQVMTTDVANSNSVYQNFTYNAFGKKTFASYPSTSSTESNGTTYTYDGLQRLTSATTSGGGTVTTEYLSGNKVKVTDAGKNSSNTRHSTTTTYLAYGEPSYEQAIKIKSPENVTTDIAINVFGDITSITQSGKNGTADISQTEYRAYDTQHSLCQIKRNDVGTTVFSRNSIGEIQWQAQGQTATSNTVCNTTASNSSKVNYTYDNLGDQRTITYGDSTPSRTFTYDNNGNVKTIDGGGFSQSYNYNSLNLLEDESLVVDGKTLSLDYGYDTLGSLSTLIYPDGLAAVNYAPNGFGQATQAIRTYADATTDEFIKAGAVYHPNGIVDSFTYGNGIHHKTSLETNGMNRPSCIRDYVGTSAPSCGSATSVVNLSYSYDNNSNITSIANARDAGIYSLTALTYDGLNRLKTTTGGDGIGSSALTYDGLGNIRTYSNTSSFDASSLTYSYSGTNYRLTGLTGTGSEGYDFNQATVSGADAYNSYDARGNIIHNGKRSFNYNRANQMTSSGGNSYTYDGYNRRVKTVDSKGTSYSMYSQSGKLLYRETDKGGINYIFLGDKLIAKEGAGVVSQGDSIMNYKPFGDSIEEPKDDVGYTGHKFDTDLGLSYMQARYYDPVIGRFYSNDPVGFKNVHNFNRYAYAANNPYKYTDPDGKDYRAHYVSIKIPFVGALDIGIVGFTPNKAGQGSNTGGVFIRAKTSASSVDSASSKGAIKQDAPIKGAVAGATVGVEYGSNTSETFDGTDASIDVGLGPVAGSVGGLNSGETSMSFELGPAIGVDASVSQTFSLTNEDVANAAKQVVEKVKEVINDL